MNEKLVSYCLFTYNQENYVKEAIEGALSQTYKPLEIIISDDNSHDNTFKIIEETINNYNGPHNIILNQNNTNLGLGGNVSKVINDISKGYYIVTCAGDDISKSNHVEYAVKAITKNKLKNMIDFNCEIIDEKSNVIKKPQLNFTEKNNYLDNYLNLDKIELFAPGRIINRKLFEMFKPISKKCPTEDSVLVLRSLMLGGFTRINKSLVYYRKHSNNLSSKNNLSKLSNLSIITQYMTDIITLYQEDILDEKTTKILLNRVNLENKLRALSFSSRDLLIQNYTRPFLKLITKYVYKIKTINER